MAMILLGVDTGGTFTDFVVWRDKTLSVHKVPSTPATPERAIWQGIEQLDLVSAVTSGNVLLVHGTTVATNAALEGKGVKTLFITNRGFADMLTLGRQARPHLYQLQPRSRPPPVSAPECLEVDCRRDAAGKVVTPLREKDLQRLIAEVNKHQAQAVAINLLFSYRDAEDEIAIAEALPKNLFVSRSSTVLPEYKEYERGIATWLNAYLGPLMQEYLRNLRAKVQPSSVTVMQSSGGTIAAELASDRAVNLLLSGPAGGLAAVKYLSEMAGLGGLMTFDMGGTSTDVALVDGELNITNEGHIGPYPVAVPMVDMHTIGAGGGSIAYADAGGLLQVGPQSAGADPGPAGYGKGGKNATVTDANVVLGRLPKDNFLAGSLALDVRASTTAILSLADQLNLTVADTAKGIIDVANEHMARALRVISVQRGYNPADFRLCSFGGAGGLHVCDLADRLGMRQAVVPVHAGVLSALGLLAAPRERQLSRGIQSPLLQINPTLIRNGLQKLLDEGVEQLIAEGLSKNCIQHQPSLDLRYQGQSASLNIIFDSIEQSEREFHQRHQQLYGHRLAVPVELVTIRQRVFAPAESMTLPTIKQQPVSRSAQVIPDQLIPAYQRPALGPETRIAGPALICEKVATTYLAEGWELEVDLFGNLLLTKC